MFSTFWFLKRSLRAAYFLFASTEWTFHSGRNEMVHSIPAGMKQFIPAGMEWAIPFRPEWNGSFHSGRNEMGHSIPAGILHNYIRLTS